MRQGKRWPSRLVATAVEDRLSRYSLTRRSQRQRADRSGTRKPMTLNWFLFTAVNWLLIQKMTIDPTRNPKNDLVLVAMGVEADHEIQVLRSACWNQHLRVRSSTGCSFVFHFLTRRRRQLVV